MGFPLLLLLERKIVWGSHLFGWILNMNENVKIKATLRPLLSRSPLLLGFSLLFEFLCMVWLTIPRFRFTETVDFSFLLPSQIIFSKKTYSSLQISGWQMLGQHKYEQRSIMRTARKCTSKNSDDQQWRWTIIILINQNKTWTNWIKHGGSTSP